ncbi:hypothetical protein LSTR_LSTR003962 [Laodelphax striatellus]|uniref:PiggyBac transposable element-derived protein domain-containing protein n=1 Tax=Laodelphax striatellus TaxID=195883 RepID=A0A482WEZ2_LAOST|nr:hypothetical protein LSTR_LSTR003962 [Laodelphax striatellus]
MALSSSEIDKLLDIPKADSDSSIDLGTSDSEVDNILAYSGSDSYEPSSDSLSDSDEYEENLSKPSSSSSHQNLDIIQDADTDSLLISNLPPPAQAQTSSSSCHLNVEIPPQDAGEPTDQESSGSRTIRVIKGKNGYRWTKQPRTSSSRTHAKNIVYVAPKIRGTAKDTTTPSQCFLSFITEENIVEIVSFTNDEIRQKQAKYKEITALVEITDPVELKAFIGVLLFSALHKYTISICKKCLIVCLVGISIKLHSVQKDSAYELESAVHDNGCSSSTEGTEITAFPEPEGDQLHEMANCTGMVHDNGCLSSTGGIEIVVFPEPEGDQMHEIANCTEMVSSLSFSLGTVSVSPTLGKLLTPRGVIRASVVGTFSQCETRLLF